MAASATVATVTLLLVALVCLGTLLFFRDPRGGSLGQQRAVAVPLNGLRSGSLLPSRQQLLEGRSSLLARPSALGLARTPLSATLGHPLALGPSPLGLSLGLGLRHSSLGALRSAPVLPPALLPQPSAPAMAPAPQLPMKKSSAGRLNPQAPRRLAHMTLPKATLERRVQICDPDAWSHIEAYFTIQAEELFNVADSEATGNFDVLRGGTSEPIFAASVLPWGASPRALLVCAAERRGEPLASCAPTLKHGGSPLDYCEELEIRGKDNRVWGTLSPQGSDVYAVFQGQGRQVLSLRGDQVNGQLVVRLADETLAHAARDPEGELLEVGIRPHIDPVLMLVCIMSVVIFNPEEVSNGNAANR